MHKMTCIGMVGEGIAPSTANPEPDVKVSLHTALQCTVLIMHTCLRHLLHAVDRGNVDGEQTGYPTDLSHLDSLVGSDRFLSGLRL